MARRWEAVAVAFITLWVGLWQAWWISRDVGPRLSGDDVPIARSTVAMFASIADGIPYRPVEFSNAPYPPAGIWLGAMGGFIVPGDPVRAMLQPQALLAAAIVPILWFALRPTLGGPVTLAAAAVAPAYAVVWSVRGQFYLELHQGIALLVVVAAWANSDRLRKPLPAALMGVGLGLGLLAKFSFVFFAAVPTALGAAVCLGATVRPAAWRVGVGVFVLGFGGVAVAAAAGEASPGWAVGSGVALVLAVGIGVWRFPADGAGARILGVTLMVGAAVAVAAPWYTQHLPELRHFLGKNLSTTAYDGEVYPVETVWWVLPGFVLRGLLDDPAALAFLVGAVRVFRDKNAFAGRFALLAVVSGVVFLTLQPYRTPRYTFPLAGAAIVVAAHAIWLPARWQTWIGALGVAWGLWLQASVAFSATPASMWWKRTCEIPPNSHGGIRQQWAQLTDRSPHTRWQLQAPLRAARAVTPELLAEVLEKADLRALFAIDSPLPPPDSCARLALDLAARGANPYVRCGRKFGPTLRVTPNGPAAVGWRVLAASSTARVEILDVASP